METHIITLKARVFSEEENDVAKLALSLFAEGNDGTADQRNLAREIVSALMER